jgi:hypothetical protein
MELPVQDGRKGGADFAPVRKNYANSAIRLCHFYISDKPQ